MPATGMGTVALRLAQLSFLLLIVLLGWMKHPLLIGGLTAFPVDLLFLVTCSLWLLAMLAGATRFRWDRGLWLVGLYFAAMAASLNQSPDLERSAFKLLTQVYLLGLSVLTFNLVRTADELKRSFAAWIASASIIGLIGTAAALLFAIAGRDNLLGWTYHHFGTLPPGPYPRLEITFLFPSMLANFLGVGLMLVLIANKSGWLRAQAALPLLIVIAVGTFFSLTPGLGGVVFIVAVWAWYCNRDRRPGLASASLAFGIAIPLLATVAAAVSPTAMASSPFFIEIPGLPPLAPSVRLLAWKEAIDNIITAPILGRGLGTEAVHVQYWDRPCGLQCVTDAHNVYLNVATQCGLLGVAALLALILWVARILVGAVREGSAVTAGLCIAWLGSFAVQGLVGSFEDQRHLWVLFGLVLSARRIFDSEVPGSTESSRPPSAGSRRSRSVE